MRSPVECFQVVAFLVDVLQDVFVEGVRLLHPYLKIAVSVRQNIFIGVLQYVVHLIYFKE